MPRASMENLLMRDGGLAANMQRPDAPYELDEEETTEWYRVVNSMPHDHFIPANYHLLVSLCEHIVEKRRLSRLIKSYCIRKDRVDVAIYLDMCKQREAESMMVLKYSRSCRLTQQSTKNKTAVVLKRDAARQIDMSGDETW